MRYAINLRMPPIFALGPKLSLEKAVQLFAKFDHLEICNMTYKDALFLLTVAFSGWMPSADDTHAAAPVLAPNVVSFLVQTLRDFRKSPTSCRIDADIFGDCHLSKDILKCKCTLCIYGNKESTNLGKVMNLFTYIDRLILFNGVLARVSSTLQIEHVTLMSVSTYRCESRALLRLFAAVKQTFQMDKFPVCSSIESCRLFKRFLRIEKSPWFVIMDNFPNALKSHLLDLGASIGGTSLPGETPLFVDMRTNFAFVVPVMVPVT